MLCDIKIDSPCFLFFHDFSFLFCFIYNRRSNDKFDVLLYQLALAALRIANGILGVVDFDRLI